MPDSYNNRIQTITELTLSIKGVLESGFAFVTVIGEISNLKVPYSGHLYFTLKDHKAQLKAVMFKTQQRYLHIKPTDGTEVICRGRISVYEARGEYQLLVDTMDVKGAGALRIAFEELKARLAAEGLFDPGHKKALPLLPARISVVTAPNSAAVFDFLKVAGNRFAGIPLEIFAVRVQGADAADDIAAALALVNERHNSEVIVLCRGGGSIEDLWPFNEEKVARAIYHSRIPVVSAIGHEIDFTIADFVADRRAPTPTAAAQAVVPDRAALHEQVTALSRRLALTIAQKLAAIRHRLQILRQKLGDPSSSLAHQFLRLDQATAALSHAATTRLHREQLRLSTARARLLRQDPRHCLARERQHTRELQRKLVLLSRQHLDRRTARLRQAMSLLEAVSPLAVLARGYSIARSTATGRIVRASQEVTIGETIDIRLHQGYLLCTVSEKDDDQGSARDRSPASP